jgi:hypothetical protein
MKAHEVIKPRPLTLLIHFGKQPVVTSNPYRDRNSARIPNQIASKTISRYCLSLCEQVGNEDSNHGEFFFLWDLYLCSISFMTAKIYTIINKKIIGRNKISLDFLWYVKKIQTVMTINNGVDACYHFLLYSITVL